MSLTILCVSEGEPHADAFLEDMSAAAQVLGATFVHVDGAGAGCIENVLDGALEQCPDDGYILRLDDDERISLDMLLWLASEVYLAADNWSFPRWNLYPDADHYIATPPVWPDLQTRLSVKAKAGGRCAPHEASPYGRGQVAPVAIEHHKFLVRSRAVREHLVARYEALSPGAGQPPYLIFSVPELYAVDCREVDPTAAETFAANA